MVQWSDSFWGEGNRGLEVLSSNIKNGLIAIEEFQRFLTESAQCESTYHKNLSRLQTQFLKIQHVGTFTPIWNLIRDLLDKISSTHLLTANFYQELLRDIHNYHELYQRKVKTHIQKDGDINRTTDLIAQLNSALNTVNKAKEQYYSIAVDYERSKRSGNNFLSTSSLTPSQDSSSPSLAQTALHSLTARHTDRSERKYRQAQDEYKATIEKYNIIRNDYEKRFSDASSKYQAFEIDHIERMLVFSLNYSGILQRNTEQIRTAQNDFNDKLKLLTGNDLLDAFVEQKKTGTDRPPILQFEEIDQLKTSLQLTNSNPHDLSTGQEDFNSLNQFESGLPSFQAHFTIPSPNTKHPDNNRALSAHSASIDSVASSPNSTAVSVSPMTATNSLPRSQETNNGNDQIAYPFDVKIKKPKFTNLFLPNRKDKKEKENEKRTSTNTITSRLSKTRQTHEKSSGNNLQNFNHEPNDFDNSDDYTQISSNSNKDKCPTPEPYSQSSPPISTNDTNRYNSQSTTPFSPSKSSSSSDTSDDDDDNMMTKIYVKINQPVSQVVSEGDGDETKIINAMRLVDKNLGNFATNTRGSPYINPDMNKSVSSGQIGTRILPPPPLPPRSITTSVTADNVDHSNMFPPNDEFAQFPFDSLNITSIDQDNLSIPSRSTTESKNTTSISSNDDDTEVANSFPNNDSTNKTTSFPILQVPSLYQSNQQQSMLTSMSPSIASMNQNFSNSPIISNEIGISPLTIGATDQIPLAIAFQETIHVMMSGDKQENWKSRIVGEMLISFPASMLTLLIDSARAANTLEFRLQNIDTIENITAKPSLITENESSSELIYSFDMTELNNVLRNLQEKNPSSPFFNINILNYEIKQPDVSIIPIEISSQWTRTIDTISVNIKYHFNSSSLPESIRLNNNMVIFYTIITDGQQVKGSTPIGEWSTNEHKLWWKVPYITDGTGSLSATVITLQTDTDENEQPLTTSSIVKAYFVGENALFSSIDFDLTSRGYRISLLKKKILSGQYQSEPDQSEPIHLFQRPTKSPLSDT